MTDQTSGLVERAREMAAKLQSYDGRLIGLNDIRQVIEGLVKRIEDTENVVSHAWVHSGYADCGYGQMGSDLRATYNRIIGRKEVVPGVFAYADDESHDAARATKGVPHV